MMAFRSLRVRVSQGTQYISDLRNAVPKGFRGLPVIQESACITDCVKCKEICPTEAIHLPPVSIDLGKCVFCGECADVCVDNKITFSSNPHMGSVSPSDLLISEGASSLKKIETSKPFARLFGRSLKMRQVSAGGCNACELELNATANVNFDVQRYGIEWVASPRHADALVITGPLTKTMKDALQLAWDAMPEPRFLVAVGACAISGGLYNGATGIDRSFLESIGPSLFIPGCPPHPLTFIQALMDFLGIE